MIKLRHLLRKVDHFSRPALTRIGFYNGGQPYRWCSPPASHDRIAHIESPFGTYDIVLPTHGELDAYRSSISGLGHIDHVHTALVALTAPQDAILDLGANIGAVTIPLSKAGRRVIAYEALSENAGLLKESIDWNGLAELAEVRHAAVWDKGGAVKIGGFSAWGVVAEAGDTVRCVALGEEPLPHIVAIKMDIEGSELHALRGMQDLIEKQCPHVIFEANTIALAPQGGAVSDLLSFFEERDYFIYRLSSGMRAVPV